MQLIVVTLIFFKGLELKKIWFRGERRKQLLEILVDVISI